MWGQVSAGWMSYVFGVRSKPFCTKSSVLVLNFLGSVVVYHSLSWRVFVLHRIDPKERCEIPTSPRFLLSNHNDGEANFEMAACSVPLIGTVALVLFSTAVSTVVCKFRCVDSAV